jgi:hypothetical protein
MMCDYNCWSHECRSLVGWIGYDMIPLNNDFHSVLHFLISAFIIHSMILSYVVHSIMKFFIVAQTPVMTVC